MIKTNIRPFYLKLIFTSLGFILFLGGFILALVIYGKIIIKKTQTIAELKREIVQNQSQQEKASRFIQLKNFFQQRTGKELSEVLLSLQQLTNPDFEEIKNIILKKFDEEKWKIINSTFNSEEKKIGLTAELPSGSLNNLFDFLSQNLLVPKIEGFKIIKKEGSIYYLEISFKL